MAETTCPVCQGVAAGGRIRLTDEGAAQLEQLILADLKLAIANRVIARDAGHDAQVYRDRVKLDEQLLREIGRTQTEMGWLDGQPQRSHS